MRYQVNQGIVLIGMPKHGVDGPVAPHLAAFAQSLGNEGYERPYLRRQVMLAALFSRWLHRRGIQAGEIENEHARKYLRDRHQDRHTDKGDRSSLEHLLDFLSSKNVIRSASIPKHPAFSIGRCIQSYERYLRSDRGLAESTILYYVEFVGDFLSNCFKKRPVELSRLRCADVVRFVESQSRRLGIKRAKLMMTALRSFLGYARFSGETSLALARSVPVVANWSMSSIPRAISADQTKRLLASIDRNSAMGLRDYAVLLLLARLGLRAGEVAAINLDDIDWQAGQMSVSGKSGRRAQLPLSPEVGKALAAYVQRGRPRCSERRLFVRMTAPIRGLPSGSAISTIVAGRIARAKIVAPTFGAHQFRHGLATDMLRKGASLAAIGAVLGHQHPDTTRIYSKVDLKALQSIAPPWPAAS
jgi:site-specific recombinase XerD